MKRARSDSAESAVEAVQAASADQIEPPEHIVLRKGDLPFWNAIVSARARYTWTDVDMAHAANLASCQADIERLKAELVADGDLITNARGTEIVNPKHNLLESLSRRSVALSRMLHVHAEATVGKSEDAPKAAAVEKQAKADSKVGQGLIPRLSAVK